MSDEIRVEVAYARGEDQAVVRIMVPPGTTVKQAIERSGMRANFPEIDLAVNKVGIFGKLVKTDTVLRDRDRVEIYRALLADPKEVRRQRAAEGKAMKKGSGESPPD